ncbi:MAG TPA: BON domain-containing protein [Kiritimatiellia bacterium]|nr:BON domain-containing protein [Kiritimatiellia bacterium]
MKMKAWIVQVLVGLLLLGLWSGCQMAGLSQGPEMSAEDRQLVVAVRERLAMDVVVMNQVYSIFARDGVVTVSGVVPDLGTRMRTLNIIRGTQGVRDVVDQLTTF